MYRRRSSLSRIRSEDLHAFLIFISVFLFLCEIACDLLRGLLDHFLR